MCRFVLYLGHPVALSSLITESENSLIHQSFASREREEPLNGDGFGVAWYAPAISPEAARFRMITPAWSSQNLRHLARITRSTCVLAHVRAASEGLPVTETNTHPYVHDRYTFMHNGEIAGFARIKRALLDGLGDTAYHMIEGTTDSEHLFALFLERRLREERRESHEALAHALEGAVSDVLCLLADAGVQEPSYLNLAVADGSSAVVCRYTNGPEADAPSLHWHSGKRYHCDDEGVPRLLDAEVGEHAVIVASEALTEDAEWTVVPPNHLVVISPHREVEVRPFAPAAESSAP
jgi:glutamine amidotransferase